VLDIIEKLQEKGTTVAYHDPFTRKYQGSAPVAGVSGSIARATGSDPVPA
jgi:hypothetical protein